MNYLNKFQGCLSGVALGDALGMPWEAYTVEQLLIATNGLGVTGLVNSSYRKVADTQNLSLGSTTDDWQLTQAVAQSLIRRTDFNILDQTLEHINELQTSIFGWGRTTRESLAELKLYIDSYGKAGRSPYDWAVGTGCGNGIAMKVAPIALWTALRAREGQAKLLDLSCDSTAVMAFVSRELRDQVIALGRLTHPDKRATVAAYAIASIIFDIITFDLFHNTTQTAEHLDPKSEGKWLLTRTIANCQSLEHELKLTGDDQFSSQLSKLLDLELLFGSIEKLRAVTGAGCWALESCCFAIAVFLRHPTDIRVGILEAVSQAADADSNGCQVGAMIGTVVGSENLPSDWIAQIPNSSEALGLGQKLYLAAEKSLCLQKN